MTGISGRIQPAMEQTAQEILQAVENIEFQVNDTSGVVVGSNGKKYKANMSPQDVYAPTFDFSVLFQEQVKAIIGKTVSFQTFDKWSHVKDDIYIGWVSAAQNADSATFWAFVVYDFSIMKVLSYYKINDIPDVRAFTSNGAYPMKLIGAGNGNGSSVSQILNKFSDDKYLYVLCGNYNSATSSYNSKAMVFDTNTFEYKRLIDFTTDNTGHFSAQSSPNETTMLNGDLLVKTNQAQMFFYKATRDGNGDIVLFTKITPVGNNGTNGYLQPSNFNAALTKMYLMIPLDETRYIMVGANTSSNPYVFLVNITQNGAFTIASFQSTSLSVPYIVMERFTLKKHSNGKEFLFIQCHSTVMLYVVVDGSAISIQSYMSVPNGALVINPNKDEFWASYTTTQNTIALYGGDYVASYLRTYVEDSSEFSQGINYVSDRPLAKMFASEAVFSSSNSNLMDSSSMNLSPDVTFILTDGSIVSRFLLGGMANWTKWVPTKSILGYIEVGGEAE